MIRVAGYCRVSTDQTDQLHSLEAQKRYFRDYIGARSDWELVAVYADEGITGTSTKKREAFNRMIAAARDGKIDLIITKEVSRFSRNILDTIAYTRELKARGVGVLFLSDGIHTMEPDAELRLSIMASIAQEESRKTSARVKWGQTRRMEQGIVFGHALLGYELKNGRLTVKEKEAALVRRIFRLYGEEKWSTGRIAAVLSAERQCKASGDTHWSSRYVLRVLKNEKYVGDLVQKKSYTPDYLNHEKRINHGAEEKIVLRDHHAAIIDRRLWEQVQREICCRDTRGGRKTTVFGENAFSGKIYCGECGAAFVRRQRRREDGRVSCYWRCSRAVRNGVNRDDGCAVGRLIREDDAVSMVLQALQELSFDRSDMTDSVARLAFAALHSHRETQSKREIELRREQERILAKKDAAIDAYLAGLITDEELLRIKERYSVALQSAENDLSDVKENDDTYIDEKRFSEKMRASILSALSGERFSEAFCRRLPLRLTVYRERPIELSFSGLEQIFYFQPVENKKLSIAAKEELW